MAGVSETFPVTDNNTRCHNPQEHINFLYRKYVKSHTDFHIPLGYFIFHLATFLLMATTTIIDDKEENDNVNTQRAMTSSVHIYLPTGTRTSFFSLSHHKY